MIDLTCATLVSAIYNNNPERLSTTLRMLRYMQSVAKFGRVILFSAVDMNPPTAYAGFIGDALKIPEMSSEAFQAFTIQEIPKHISTPFMMNCHDDGMIIDPSLWSEDFLKYDYIGAPWGDHVVGNEGFSIQSQRALWAKSKIASVDTPQADEFVCRTMRQHMENLGVQFAPVDVAIRFSTETWGNELPSLGYHGVTHSPEKHERACRLIEAFEKGSA